MKLSKDQIQKIILGSMIFFGVIYAYFEFLIGPLGTARDAAMKDMEALSPKLAEARAQISKTKTLEEKAPASQMVLEQVQAMIPQGAPIAWVPTKLSELFKREGIEKMTARKAGEPAEKELTGFARLSWAVEIPKVDFLTMAGAVAALENSEPLMEIQTVDIEPLRENVQLQRVSMMLYNIARP